MLVYILLVFLLRPVEFESTHIVWKTNGLPLTYGRDVFFITLSLKMRNIFKIPLVSFRLVSLRFTLYFYFFQHINQRR